MAREEEVSRLLMAPIIDDATLRALGFEPSSIGAGEFADFVQEMCGAPPEAGGHHLPGAGRAVSSVQLLPRQHRQTNLLQPPLWQTRWSLLPHLSREKSPTF